MVTCKTLQNLHARSTRVSENVDANLWETDSSCSFCDRFFNVKPSR